MKSIKFILRTTALFLCLSLIAATIVAAGELNAFPIINNLDESILVADANTEYITLFEQDPITKLITATVQIKHGGAGPQNLEINGIGIEISFNSKVAPCAYDTKALFQPGKSVSNGAEFQKYCKALISHCSDFGAQIIQRETGGGFLGAKLSCSGVYYDPVADKVRPNRVEIQPGQTISVAEFYFMPVNNADGLDLDMFSFEYIYDSGTFTRAATWMGNGSFSLQATSKGMTSIMNYYVSPGSFKLHARRPAPGVSANNSSRTVTGYDAATMEWSNSANGPYSSAAPTAADIGGGAKTIYVRAKGDDDYTGNDALYGAYKKYLPGAAVEVAFSAVTQPPTGAAPSIKKTGENLTSSDGKTRVGDVIKYTINITNIGADGSVWSNAILSDQISEFVIFDEDSVKTTGAVGMCTYDKETGLFTAELGNISKGQTRTISFQVKVAENASGKNITNTAAVDGKDGAGGGGLGETTDENGGGRTVEPDPDISALPEVDQITENDSKITGKGEPGAQITVTLPDDSELTVTVDTGGKWSVDIPDGKQPGAGDKIVVVQTEKGKNASDPVVITVIAGKKVVVTFNPAAGTLQGAASSKTVTVGAQYGTLPTPVREGPYTFEGWYTAPESTGGTVVTSASIVETLTDHTLYAHWVSTGGGYSNEGPFTVTFHSNYAPDSVIARVYNIPGGSSVGARMPANPARFGYTFIGWNTSVNGSGQRITDTTTITRHLSVYAQWRGDGNYGGYENGGDVIIDGGGPPLAGFLTDHVPYIGGYPDDSMRPNNPITRAEVAMIFFRLLSNPEKDRPGVSAFSDVADGMWFAQAIDYLASINILNGYPDGSFRPNQPITRAEFAAVASRFDDLVPTDDNMFPDVADHWARDFINSAYAKGWVNGYPDGTFRPLQNITRAEVVKVVNTMLDRKIRPENIPAGIRVFNDVVGHWAYADIVEASNAHDYIRRNDGYETWTLK